MNEWMDVGISFSLSLPHHPYLSSSPPASMHGAQALERPSHSCYIRALAARHIARSGLDKAHAQAVLQHWNQPKPNNNNKKKTYGRQKGRNSRDARRGCGYIPIIKLISIRLRNGGDKRGVPNTARRVSARKVQRANTERSTFMQA